MTIGPGFDDVLAAAQTGAGWAVAILYRDLQPGLLRYLQAKVPGQAEDLASEVWLAAAPKLVAFEGDEVGFRNWIFTIAHRRVIDHIRKSARRQTDPVDGMRFEQRAAADDTADAGIEEVSAREAIDALTAGLPADQAEVVLLRVVGGLGVDEVAQLMGRSAGSVRVLQHRALRRMARRLAATQDAAVTN